MRRVLVHLELVHFIHGFRLLELHLGLIEGRSIVIGSIAHLVCIPILEGWLWLSLFIGLHSHVWI